MHNNKHRHSAYHLKKAVEIWREERLKETTIKCRISAIRRFCRISGIKRPIPSASDLGILVPHTKEFKFQTIDNSRSIVDLFYHPASKHLAKKQLFFGLSKSEALYLDLQGNLLDKDNLLVPKGLSSNGKDRVVPILNEAQRDALKEKIAYTDKESLRIIYQSELKLNNFKHDLSLYYIFFREADISVLSAETGVPLGKIKIIKSAEK